MWFWAKKWKWQYITKCCFCCFCCVSGYHDVDFWKLQNVEMLLAIFIFLISSMVKKLWLVEVEKGVRSSPIYDDFTCSMHIGNGACAFEGRWNATCALEIERAHLDDLWNAACALEMEHARFDDLRGRHLQSSTWA